jgi:hypothetical protein
VVDKSTAANLTLSVSRHSSQPDGRVSIVPFLLAAAAAYWCLLLLVCVSRPSSPLMSSGRLRYPAP